MSLLVVGSIAYDTIETPNKEATEALGGTAIHFSSASSFFTKTRVVGIVGKDFDMEEIDFLKKRDADLSGITVSDGKTFRWSGKYHTNMNDRDTLSTELNVLEQFDPKIPESFKDSKYIFLGNILPQLQMSVLEQVNDPKFVTLDTMDFWIDGAKEALDAVIERVDGVILNDSEARLYSGEHNLVDAAKHIAAKGPKIVIIKKGEHGSLLFHDGSFFVLPAFLIDKVVDPTGAGDSFAGGFMGYIAQRDAIDVDTLKMAMAYGTCTASFNCEDFGPESLKNLRLDALEKRVSLLEKQIKLR